MRTDVIQGMGKHNGQFIIILEIDKIFSGDGLSPARADLPAGERAAAA
jgi:hypothetical protein